MNVSEFVLKATPPRMLRAALERERLRAAWQRHHDRTVLLAIAPAGFGKTTQLLQWRRWWIDAGTQVAWLGVGEQEHPARFAFALGHSLRLAGISDAVADPKAWNQGDPWSGLTRLLADIAARGTPVGLVIDDAEHLPEATVRGALQYVLLNAPANLHVAIGSRVALPLQLAQLAAKDQLATLGAEDLRLRFEESNAILQARMGEKLTLDDRARLHEATEGWPIGLQLAIGEIERAEDPSLAVHTLSARRGPLQDYFVTALLADLPRGVAHALVRAAILEHFDADLFQAVTECKQPGAMLERLVRDTPLMTAGERSDWMRLHPLARDFLLSRFEALPLAERNALHVRASRWYAERERFHEAATHALAAGDEALSQTYAARALWALATAGMLAEAREWLDRLPREMVDGDRQLQLVGASILAFSERNADALAMARDVLEDAEAPPHVRASALRIASGAAVFADRLGLLPGFLARWPDTAKEGEGPLYALAALNTRAMFALHAGDTAHVRALVAQQAPHGSTGTLRLAAALGRMVGAMSHLWDGHPARAEAALLPALLQAEKNGRRSVIACLLASIVATAIYQRGDAAQAQAMLADRLDVLERVGLPDNLMLAYRTLAFAALESGNERDAMAALQQLDALAVRRGLPRVRAVSLSEQIRLHAAHQRRETVARLLDTMESLAPAFDDADMLPLRSEYRLATAIARAHAALGEERLEAAELHLADADAIAESLNRGYDVLRIKMLRGLVGAKRGDAAAEALLREANELTSITGHARLAADSHPQAERLLAQARAAARAARMSIPPGSPMLTSKEAEVLDLLGKGLPNKAIARALDVSGETVKWHLKNLFVKLSAGSRRHAVERARMLGLVG